MKTFALLAGGEVLREQDSGLDVPWWSFTKTLMAAAALRLAERGALALDEPASAGWTLRQLLGHTAGLPDYGGVAAYHEAVRARAEPWSRDEVRLQAGAPLFRPGEGWSYSNVGYLDVRERLEAAVGGSLDAALQDLVLRPLGITDARVARTPEELVGVAMGPDAGYHPGWVYHGLVVGPVASAAVTLDRLMTGDLLSRESLAAMRASHPLPHFNRPPWGLAAYGLGLMTPCLPDGAPAWGHTGGGPGSGIAVYHLPRMGRTIALFDDSDAEAAAMAEAAS